MTEEKRMKAMRTSEEIRAAFEAKGCVVCVRHLGQSYRAGGEIMILAPGLYWETLFGEPGDQGFSFAPADFDAFDGTGYDGRGRHYKVWLVTPGDYVRCSAAEFANAAEGRRISFGTESRSCGNEVWFCHRDEKKSRGLADLGNAFAALGL